MSKLNLYRNDIFLERQEIQQLIDFNNNDLSKKMWIANTNTFGILEVGLDATGDEASFNVQQDGVGTVKIEGIESRGGSLAFDTEGNMITLPYNTTDLRVPVSDKWYWMRVRHRYNVVEPNPVNINANGEMSGTGFNDVLRGNSTGHPLIIRFYQKTYDTTSGVYSARTFEPLDGSTGNASIYQVQEVSDDNNAILEGDFTALNDIYYSVLGCYANGSPIYIPNSTDGLYNYDDCNIEFVEETVTNTAPVLSTADADMVFYFARVYHTLSTQTVTIQDKRAGYYYVLNT